MKRLWLLLIFPILLVLWWGLDARDSTPEVHFAQVRKLSIASTVPTNGKVEPAEWAAARAETSGVVRTVNVQRGQNVTAGQTLVTLDTSAAEADLAAALAKQQEARSDVQIFEQGGKTGTLASLDDRIRSAQATVDVAQRNADSLQRLLPQQAATKLQVQDALDALARAKLQVASLQNERKTLVTTSDRTVARAKLRDAEAAVALAQHQVSLGVIKAPLSGTVYQFDLKVGAYLQPGTLVALLGNLDQVKVIVYVDEPDLGRISEGMPVSITWDARPGQKWWGHINKRPTEVVALGTRTVGEVSTTVSNPNHDLLPGVTINATIISAVAKDALSVPKQALRTVRGENGVYRLNRNTVVWVPVKNGISDVNNVEILAGLQAGDRVALPADVEIKDGARVKPVLE
jgi:HlyD family secretion protein